MPGGQLRPSQLCGSACRSVTLLPKDRRPANGPSCTHREQYYCTPIASPSWRIWGFPFWSQHRDYLQAVSSLGGTCHAQTTSLTGCRFQVSCTGRDHPHVFCVLYWAVESCRVTSAYKRPWLSSHWSHRTALCGCLRRLQCNLLSGLGCPERPPCPSFLPSRRALCSLCLD